MHVVTHSPGRRRRLPNLLQANYHGYGRQTGGAYLLPMAACGDVYGA